MGRASLPDSYALIILPESSIHTFFMRVPIDVLFVDRSDKVIGTAAGGDVGRDLGCLPSRRR
jgi:uncharacterized membrane protein (UPF0127 family)